jgi:uncharacterized membrane protein YozB (DUF420 family)
MNRLREIGFSSASGFYTIARGSELGDFIMATLAPSAVRDQSFWQKMMIGLALFIVFGFAQFAGRGFVDVGRVPLYVHFHGALMLCWLGLSVVQATLIQRSNLALHRRLGWLGVALAAGVVITGSFVGLMAIQTGRQPPFFTPPFFLALTQIGILFFAAIFALAVARRKQTEWHRRLMLSALIMILEPALGRVLPMPLMIPWSEWAVLAIQLGVFGIIARHDRKVLGYVHPATLTGMAIVTAAHVVVETVSRIPAWVALAEGLTPA